MASLYTARLADAVKALVEAHVADDDSAIAAALSAIEQRATNIGPRGRVPFATTIDVYRRDCWTCRYCSGKTIAPPVLRTLSSLHPDEFRFQSNWKAGQVHPAYLLLSPSLDHVRPVGRPGSSSGPDNLVTACWPCNSGKADFTLDELGLALLTEDDVRSAWDGLTHAYAALWKAAGGRDAVWHRPWLRALGVPEGA